MVCGKRVGWVCGGSRYGVGSQVSMLWVGGRGV